MSDFYTEDFAEFGIREIKLLNVLLAAWIEQGLPDDFYNDGVKPALNKQSGYVFLTNSEYQVAMMNGERLESHYSLPHSGDEGFLSELIEEFLLDDLHHVDKKFILDLAETAEMDLPNQSL